jgi:hypothetical protein
MEKAIDINLNIQMFAVLSALTGLAVAVMQDDKESAQGFATMLSEPEMEPIAMEIIDLLQSVSRDLRDGPSRPKIEIVS